jgi:anti-anti-sigma regulatory factor
MRVLRISMNNDSPVATLKVEGRLVGPWATELEKTWRDLWASARQRSLRLDLRGVSFVDSDGARILREIVKVTRAEVCADSPLTQYFANQARGTIVPKPTEEK